LQLGELFDTSLFGVLREMVERQEAKSYEGTVPTKTNLLHSSLWGLFKICHEHGKLAFSQFLELMNAEKMNEEQLKNAARQIAIQHYLFHLVCTLFLFFF
jgi:hypothetical protein